MLRRYLVLLPVGFDRSLFVSSSAGMYVQCVVNVNDWILYFIIPIFC